MDYSTIQVSGTTKRRLNQLREYPRETYEETLKKLLDLVPEGDDEGKYKPGFRAGILRGLADIRHGRTHSQEEVMRRLGMK